VLASLCTSNPAAVRHRVALGFLNEDGDVLLRVCSVAILRFDGDAIEDPEVVQTPLRFDNVAFAERLFDFDVHLSMDHSRSCVLVATDKNAPHACLRAFQNVIHKPYRFGLLNRRLGILFLLLLFSFVLRRSRAPSGVRFLCRRTGGDAFRRCRKARLGKSFVKIKRQNVVPVCRYARNRNTVAPESSR